MEIGIGDSQASLKVYIANRPPLPEFELLKDLRPLSAGEIAAIVCATGNHWRKIFNLYAKLVFELGGTSQPSWQGYRDNCLLQADSGQALLFSEPELGQGDTVHIVAGYSHAEALDLGDGLEAVGSGFRVDGERRLVISPYFDYRQLSNAKLAELVGLVKAL